MDAMPVPEGEVSSLSGAARKSLVDKWGAAQSTFSSSIQEDRLSLPQNR